VLLLNEYFIFVIAYFVIDSVRKLSDIPSYTQILQLYTHTHTHTQRSWGTARRSRRESKRV